MLTRLIALGALLLQFFLPWWIIAPVAFLFALWRAKSASHAFKAGFSGIFALWIVMALIKSLPNNNLLANRIGQMLMLPAGEHNWFLVVLISALIGGIVGGAAAFSGYYWGGVMRKRA